QKSFQGSYPVLDPDTTRKLFEEINKKISASEFNNNQPVILCSPRIRPAFRKLTEIVFPNIRVISMNEIPTDIQIETVGVVTI
ncbi:MAG TPA: EscV/YscV/HrcV family type III secretion system export apparatus protein, partial [Clostridiaceae bacterium]|nr:EscV/YscV/HrcV family type III secretion system export apparatus protein [Clostridiaceae bacterium]